jgi:hypothetical protein
VTTKVKILIAAGTALVVFFLIFRRRAQAAQAQVYGVTAGTPAPQTGITNVLAPPPGMTVGQLPGLATQAALGYASSVLPPIVNQGVQAVIAQSSAKPVDNPCGLPASDLEQLAKVHPNDRARVAADFCRINAERAAGAYKPGPFAAVAAAIAKAQGR